MKKTDSKASEQQSVDRQGRNGSPWLEPVTPPEKQGLGTVDQPLSPAGSGNENQERVKQEMKVTDSTVANTGRERGSKKIKEDREKETQPSGKGENKSHHEQEKLDARRRKFEAGNAASSQETRKIVLKSSDPPKKVEKKKKEEKLREEVDEKKKKKKKKSKEEDEEDEDDDEEEDASVKYKSSKKKKKEKKRKKDSKKKKKKHKKVESDSEDEEKSPVVSKTSKDSEYCIVWLAFLVQYYKFDYLKIFCAISFETLQSETRYENY